MGERLLKPGQRVVIALPISALVSHMPGRYEAGWRSRKRRIIVWEKPIPLRHSLARKNDR